MKNSKLYTVHCLSPVHVGTGEGIGIIDMPIIREKTTEWPYVPGSSIKGVEREYYLTNGDLQWVEAAFGKASSHKEDSGYAGAFIFSDARLLAFPVASRYGTFAYVSCPFALKRMQRDLAATGTAMPTLDWDSIDAVLQSGDYAIVNMPTAVTGEAPGQKYIELDEFRCPVNTDGLIPEEWMSWLTDQLFDESDDMFKSWFAKRFVIVSDEAFQYFATSCSEIVPRIRIDQEKKTTERGALWYEEYIPTEAILYGIVWCDRVNAPGSSLNEKQLLHQLSGEQYIQIGANATVGKGRVRLRFFGGERS
ncbi:type III-B CRISPR module RAMP protein Cmr4 [Paenibacillus sp. GCM10012307]|uniref:Type III-B CRISPR module RAMP protein Cmr4 n=1 Tax=Paenibacillus roseus TaxID=2798579 RepID=A0A934MT61_9BACL|nr:type III-B CRISPR module RAMP protein Cmr4 [Paenibacillus roseus]MBJ6363924.1 type III-B CRISPR module RAMP protein Cmr4 [Paenibacillus roseus]